MTTLIGIIILFYILGSIWYIFFEDHTKIVYKTTSYTSEPELPQPQPIEFFPFIPLESYTLPNYEKYYWAKVNGQWQLRIKPQPDDFEGTIIFPDIDMFTMHDSLFRFTEKRYGAKKYQIFIWQEPFLNVEPQNTLSLDSNIALNSYSNNWICLANQ